MQITPAEIAETLAMVSKQNLDIRTITLGLNLRSCVDSDIDRLAAKVYDRMTTAAEHLVPTAEQLEREFGIPIVNKRISVTPIAEVCAAVTANESSPVAVAMDRAGKEVGVDFVLAASPPSCKKAFPPRTTSSWIPSPTPWPPPTACARR